MFKLELDELRGMIHDEQDAKLKGTLIVLLCLADKVSVNSENIITLEAKSATHDLFIVKVNTGYKIIVWFMTIIQVIVLTIFAYIFETLNTLTARQGVVLSTLENIKARNAAANNIQRDLHNEMDKNNHNKQQRLP